MASSPMNSKRDSDDEDHRRGQVINWKDAKNAAGIELSVIPRVRSRVIQNAGNQKTGEHEKEGYSGPSQAKNLGDCSYRSDRALVSTAAVVEQEHGDYRDSTQPVQSENPPAGVELSHVLLRLSRLRLLPYKCHEASDDSVCRKNPSGGESRSRGRGFSSIWSRSAITVCDKLWQQNPS